MVFFTSLGIKFEYEPQGFQTKAGKRYLPDFYLPHIASYAEVKPDQPNAHLDFLKAQEFVMAGMGEQILYLVGLPDFHPYTVLRRIKLPDGNESWISNVSLDIHYRPKWYAEEHRLYEGFEDAEFTGEDCFTARYMEAVYAARGERFEEMGAMVGRLK